jgi:hypothetical protein
MPRPRITQVGPSFSVRVSNGWCIPMLDGNSISSTFSPGLSGLPDLNALAQLGGFDHFNIEQEITDITGSVSPGSLPRWTGIDPSLGGNTFAQFDDQFPWYYDEVGKPDSWMPMYNDPRIFVYGSTGEISGLYWSDAPNLGPNNAGTRLTFVGYLVGVKSDHSGARISEQFPDAKNVNFSWTFTQGAWGSGSRELIRFSNFNEREPRSKGAVRFLGFFENDPARVSSTSGTPCNPRGLQRKIPRSKHQRLR